MNELPARSCERVHDAGDCHGSAGGRDEEAALGVVRRCLAVSLGIDLDRHPIGLDDELIMLPNSSSLNLLRAASLMQTELDFELDIERLSMAVTVADLHRVVLFHLSASTEKASQADERIRSAGRSR